MRALLCFLLCPALIGLAYTAYGQDRLPGFGHDGKPSRIKGFGSNADFWLKNVLEKDTKQAESWMLKYDRDKSGVLESGETVSWGKDSIATYDLNRDGRIAVRELATAIAKLRLKTEGAAREKQRQAKAAAEKQAAAKKAAAAAKPGVRVDPLVLARQQSCNVLAVELIKQHDRNGNGQLEIAEWQAAGTRFGKFSGGADRNADDIIVAPELASWLIRRLPPLAQERLAKPLRPLDVNRDGQVTLSEYASSTSEETVIAFRSLDQNNDGVISPQESHAPPVPAGAIGFANKNVKVINGQQSIFSDIWINEEIEIEDLDVRLAITKQSDNQLVLVLIGPDEQRVTLFAGGWQPWTGAYLFEGTLIDDEAPLIDKTQPQPPFPRRLRTDGLKKNEPGLRHFYSKSARGRWRLLVVNTNNNKVGVLHSWSLWVKPKRN